MDILTIILIAIGLAMDCLAVSIAQGVTVDLHDHLHRPKPVLMAMLFGFFQGGMPLISYYAGSICADFFHTYAPWVALVLLGYIGGKMVWDSLKHKEEDNCTSDWSIRRLLMLSVATSIDALTIGVLFIPHPEVLWISVAIIGLVSFIFSVCGYLTGVFMGNRFKFNVELVGGLILIGIGIKIWVEGCLL